MMKNIAIKLSLIQKTVITLVLVSWWLCGPVIGYQDVLESADSLLGNQDGTLWEWIMPHFAYMLCHANFWHLAGNLFVLWVLRGRLYLWRALVIAVVCSFMPGVGSVWEIYHGEPVPMTIGFSGVLFAIVGIKWGFWCVGQHKGRVSRKGRVLDEQRTAISPERLKSFCLKVVPFAMIGLLVPHLNWTIHLYCLTAGLFVGMLRGYNMKYI